MIYVDLEYDLHSPGVLLGAAFKGSRVISWHRINTAPSGSRHVGFGTYHTDVTVHLADGSRHAVTVITTGKDFK